MKTTVAIVGSHPATRNQFDFNRSDCDIWLFNEAVSNKSMPRADAVFQMHAEAIWRNPMNRNDPGHFAWLNTQKTVPVYMQDFYKDVPMSVKYPLDEIVDKFKIRYFTSSVSYALALACYFGYRKIELYGVEMETNTEYQYQRDGVTLWLGVALGLGIEVNAHASIFEQPLYGYEGEVVLPEDTFAKRIAELESQITPLEAEYKAASKMLARVVEDFAFRDNTDDITEALKKQVELSKALGMLDGGKHENMRYQKKAEAMKEKAQVFLFSRQEFESSAAKLMAEAQTANTQVNFLSGQGELLHHNIKLAPKGSTKRKKMLEGYKQILGQYLQAHNQSMIYAGAARENFQYMALLDKSIRAAGGAKSEAVLLEALKR